MVSTEVIVWGSHPAYDAGVVALVRALT
jgi:hypothetical protein